MTAMEHLTKVMDLQLRLRTLREEFQTTRPLLPEETRDFTYDKPVYVAGHTIVRWERVTEKVKVKLRQFGIPSVEARVHELCEDMRDVKRQIIDLGDVPEGYDRVNPNRQEEQHG
jgi:hypothetical protein